MANEHIKLPGIDPVTLSTAQPPAGPTPAQPISYQTISAQTPLTPEQLQYLQAAGNSYRIIRKTAGVALFSGVTSLILGIGSVGCLGISHDSLGIFATLVLLTVGVVELVGRQRLLNGNPRALRLLAFNQLGFLAAIAIYCVTQIVTFSAKSLTQSLNSQLREAGGGDLGNLIDPQMAQSLNTTLYVSVLVVAIASQGGLALYYWRRQKHLDAYLTAEPWQRQLLQTVSS